MQNELEELSCRDLTGEQILFTKHNKECLEGMICLYVDDFIYSGNGSFHNEVIEKIQKKFTFGKKEQDSFRFRGLDI